MSSAKNSSQPTRRTPLTLGPTAAKQQHQSQQHQANKQATGSIGNSNKQATGSNGNSNANSASKGNQKSEPTIEIKEIKKPTQQQQQQNAVEKKPPNTAADNAKKSEKNDEKKTQNGVGKSNGNPNNKQQQQQNGPDANGANELAKDKKEKEKATVEKSAKEEKKEKEVEKKEQADKKEPAEKKEKDTEKKEKDTDKKEKETEKREKDTENKVEKETRAKKAEIEKDAAEKKKAEKDSAEPTKMDMSNSEQKATTPSKPVAQQKTTPVKPLSKSTAAASPPPTAKSAEKKGSQIKLNFAATIPIDDDVEMEPLTLEASPSKAKAPVATSTPGKPGLLTSVGKRAVAAAAAVAGIKSEAQLSQPSSPDRNNCPRSFAAISGRRSIRPLSDYTPSHFQSNSQFRESYRRINTELDTTSNTNTSLDVTVGSEVPNCSSFSFFGRGRKRDRTTPPPLSQSNVEVDTVNTPPKRARLNVHGFLTSFISHFSKTAIDVEHDKEELQNVSGISIEEEIHDENEVTATEDLTVGHEAESDETPKKNMSTKSDNVAEKENLDVQNESQKYYLEDDAENTDDIKFKETPLVGGIDKSSAAKNKRCSIM